MTRRKPLDKAIAFGLAYGFLGNLPVKLKDSFPEPPLGFDYAKALAEADYAKTEARILASIGPGLYEQAIGRVKRKKLTRRERRIAAQLKRVRPKL
jgi:hypothetical protein